MNHTNTSHPTQNRRLSESVPDPNIPAATPMPTDPRGDEQRGSPRGRTSWSEPNMVKNILFVQIVKKHGTISRAPPRALEGVHARESP